MSLDTETEAPQGGRRLSIRDKYVLVVCGVAIFSAALLGSFNYFWVNRIAREQAYGRLLAAAELVAPRVRAAYDSLSNDATAVSRMPPFQGIVRAAANGGLDPVDGSTLEQWAARLDVIFQSMMEIRPAYFQMRYIGLAEDGLEIVRTDRIGGVIRRIPSEALQRKADRPYIQEAAGIEAGETYFSRVSPNIDSGSIDFDRQTLRAVTQVRDRSGELFGFMAINADYSRLIHDLLSEISTSGEIFIVNGNGAYICRRPDGTISRLVHAGEADHALPQPGTPLNDSNTVFLSADKRTVFARVEVDLDADHPGAADRSLAVILAQPVAEVMAPVTENGRQVLVLSVLLIAVASGLAFLLADGIIRPLRRVIAEIEGHQDLRTAPDLPVGRQDEIGSLSRAFTSLLDALRRARTIEQRAHDRLSAIMDHSAEGLITVDDGGRVLHYNKGAEAIFGYRQAAVIGSSVKLLMPDAERLAFDEFLSGRVGPARPGAVGRWREVRGLTADGRVVPLELSISEISSGGHRLFSGIFRDISERKALGQTVAVLTEELRRVRSCPAARSAGDPRQQAGPQS